MSDSIFKVAILVVSDTCFKDNSQEKVVDALSEFFKTINANAVQPRNYQIAKSAIVPDKVDEIQNLISEWTHDDNLRLILTCGGTGFTINDNTPEAIKPLIEKDAPGIVHAMISESLKITPFAIMSRPVAGVKNKSLIITLPGSPKACKENLNAIIGVLHHALTQIENKDSRALHKKMERTLKDALPGNGNEESLNHHHHHDSNSKHQGNQNCWLARHSLISNDLAAPVTQRARESPYPIISIPEAFEYISKETPESSIVTMSINDPMFVGSIIAETIEAQNHVPNFRASIVDGYAICSKDGPGTYPVVTITHASSSAANTIKAKRILKPGEIARITTGAPVPEGADAVVMVEETQLITMTDDGTEEKEIAILAKDVHPGDNIRDIGSDLKKGTIIFDAGVRISGTGGEVGLLASIGVKYVKVYKKANIGILSTGDELKNIDTIGSADVLKYGEIYDSNRPTLASTIKHNNFPVVDLGIATDSKDSLETQIKKAFMDEDVDYLITTGGVSMGELDLLKPTIERVLGGVIHFGRVKMKPGKPTTFATVKFGGKTRVIFALPGNPASATVCFHLFVLPSLFKFMGMKGGDSPMYANLPTLPLVNVKLCGEFKLDRTRTEYQRVIISQVGMELVATSTGFQRSSRIGSFQRANGLICLPSAAEHESNTISDTIVKAIMINTL